MAIPFEWVSEKKEVLLFLIAFYPKFFGQLIDFNCKSIKINWFSSGKQGFFKRGPLNEIDIANIYIITKSGNTINIFLK